MKERMYASDPDFKERDWLTFLNHCIKNPHIWFDLQEMPEEERAKTILEIEEAIRAGQEVGFNMAKGVNEIGEEPLISDE